MFSVKLAPLALLFLTNRTSQLSTLLGNFVHYWKKLYNTLFCSDKNEPPAVAFTDFFQLPPGRTEERSHSNEEIVSEKEISKALASLFSKGGNQQSLNLKGGANLFERILRIPGKEGISMDRVVAALREAITGEK